MHLKRLYQTVNKVMCHWINRMHLSCFTSLIFIIWFHTGPLKHVLSCIIARIKGFEHCITVNYVYSAGYKFCNLISFKWLRRKIKNINNISLKFIMLTDNYQIFRNCFVVIYCHLTKVSSQINKCIIF